MKFKLKDEKEEIIINPSFEIGPQGDLLIKINNINILSLTTNGVLKIRKFHKQEIDVEKLRSLGFSILDHVDGLHIQKVIE